MLDPEMIRYMALRNTKDWDQARYLAEAGLHHAIAELEQDINWRTGIAATEFPVGSGRTYSVSVEDGADGTITIHAVGQAGDFTRHLLSSIKQGG